MLSAHWEAFSAEARKNDESSASSAAAPPFSLLQWNVLADGLAQGGGFVKCPSAALEWAHRFPLIVEDIRRSNAEIVALQELNHYDDLVAKFQDYYLLWTPKLESPACKEDPSLPPDGTAMMIKRSRFDVCAIQHLYYKAADPEAPAGSHSSSSPAPLANQNGVLALLLDRAPPKGGSPRYLIVATTHLKAKEGEAIANERAGQIRQLLEAIKGLGVAESVPVLVCGDFNSPPTEVVHTTMREAAYRSVYNSDPVAAPSSGEPAFTTFKFRAAEVGVGAGAPAADGALAVDGAAAGGFFKKRCIDYIWVKGADLKILAKRALPTVDEVGPEGLPSASYPSDHLSLCAQFGWA